MLLMEVEGMVGLVAMMDHHRALCFPVGRLSEDRWGAVGSRGSGFDHECSSRDHERPDI